MPTESIGKPLNATEGADVICSNAMCCTIWKCLHRVVHKFSALECDGRVFCKPLNVDVRCCLCNSKGVMDPIENTRNIKKSLIQGLRNLAHGVGQAQDPEWCRNWAKSMLHVLLAGSDVL